MKVTTDTPQRLVVASRTPGGCLAAAGVLAIAMLATALGAEVLAIRADRRDPEPTLTLINADALHGRTVRRVSLADVRHATMAVETTIQDTRYSQSRANWWIERRAGEPLPVRLRPSVSDSFVQDLAGPLNAFLRGDEVTFRWRAAYFGLSGWLVFFALPLGLVLGVTLVHARRLEISRTDGRWRLRCLEAIQPAWRAGARDAVAAVTVGALQGHDPAVHLELRSGERLRVGPDADGLGARIAAALGCPLRDVSPEALLADWSGGRGLRAAARVLAVVGGGLLAYLLALAAATVLLT